MRFDQLGVVDAFALLHRLDVVETAEAAGDVARAQGIAFEGGDDADRVDEHRRRRAACGSMRTRSSWSGFRPKESHAEFAAFALTLQIGIDRHAVDLMLGDDEEADGMDRAEASGRKDRALHALLAADS